MGNSFSCRYLAGTISFIHGKTYVSKQAVWKRINEKSSSFLERILRHVLKEKLGRLNKSLQSKLTCFTEVLIQDSTIVGLNDKLYQIFKGSANQAKKHCNLKIQAVINIKNYSFRYFRITPYSENDQKASHSLEFLQQGNLLIRDLGYFVTEAFMKIAKRKAYFISRLKYGVSLYSRTSRSKINLLRLLKKNNFLDIQVLLSKKSKLPVRLIAVKIPDHIAAKRRKKLKNDRHPSMNPGKEHLECLGWNIFITNTTHQDLSCKDISSIYAIRWEIEIIFKSWKNAFNFKMQKCKFSKEQVLALIFARLIIITFITNICLGNMRSKNKISILAFVDFFLENRFFVFQSLFEIEKFNANKLLSKFTSYERRGRVNLKQKISMI